MLIGLFLVICTGLCWIGEGISVSVCAKHKWNYSVVQGIRYIGSTLLFALILLFHSNLSEINTRTLCLVFLLQCCSGITNFYTFVLAAKAMKMGPNGLVWGIMQAGMIGSFLMGVCFFGEQATLVRIIGLGLILGGVFCMGLGKNTQQTQSGKQWLLPAFGAFLLVMLTHCTNVLPSFLPDTAGVHNAFRALGGSVGGIVAFAITTLPGMIRARQCGGRHEWMIAALLIIISIVASAYLFYNGINALAQAGCGALGYPIAIGTCVAGFSLYSLFVLKEKITSLSKVGLIAVCLGIIIITLK